MDRQEFIQRIFRICGVQEDNIKNKELVRTYDLALSVPYKVNWDDFFKYCIKEIQKKQIPMPSFFTAKIEYFKADNDHNNQYLGWQVRIYFNSGRYSDFIICGFGPSFNEIKERCKLSAKVKKAVMYPPKVTIKDEETGHDVIMDVALIGDKVFPANTPSKVLYIAS